MNEMVLSTRNTNIGTIVARILCAVLIDCGMAAFLWWIYGRVVEKLDFYENADPYLSIFYLGMFYILYAVAQIHYNFVHVQSFMEIYDGYVKGKGVTHNIHIEEFNFKIKDINAITIRNENIYLHTNSGKYMIVSDGETAKKVMGYYYESETRNWTEKNSYHRWRCSGCGNLVDKSPCPNCGDYRDNEKSMLSEEFTEEIKNSDILDLRLMLEQEDLYTEEEIEFIKHELFIKNEALNRE